jgi:signal transduction histidine kinase
LLGYSIEHLEGRCFIDFLHPDDTAATSNVFQALLRGEIVTGYINRYRHIHGDYLPLEWWAQSINGLIYASARDVTQAKIAEQALARALEQERAAAEMKGRLISMASHEFRTPLTLIRMRAEMIALKLPNLDENTIRERLSSIVEACSYLTDIVSDVLDYTTLGRASSIEPSVEIELGSFLRDLVTGAEHGDPDNNRVQLLMSAPSVRLLTYASLLRRAIGNVVENALKYSPPESQVLVSCRANGDGAEVEIADQGIGIPEHIGSNLFNPFYRAPNVGNIRGTGLGLAICKEATDRLGGTITYDPNPAGGSIFTLRFPARPPATKPPSL